MLKIENLNFSYSEKNQILKNISFKAYPGDFIAILGNNGVGKSTLLKCINKILKIDSGKIYLDNQNLMDLKIEDIAKKLALVSQSIPNIEVSAYDMVLLGRKAHMKWKFSKKDKKIVEESMEKIGISKHMYPKYISNMSGGEVQKIMIARALAQAPELLLLDEPTSYLDIKNKHIVLNLVRNIIKKESIIGIMVIHDINLAMKYCDRFLFLKDKNIYSYGKIDIITDKLILDVYDVKASLCNIKEQRIMLVD